MKKFYLLLLSLLIAGALRAESVLNLTISGFPARLNPLLATDSVSAEISDYLFEGLVKYDKDANVVGEIAESWEFIDDRAIVFKLREDRYWHDGKKVTAQDALFTYQTAISDRVSSPYASNFRAVEKVEVLNDFTLKVTYKTPYFKALETWMMPLIPKHILENDLDLMTSTFNSRPIGNSYFRIDELSISKNIELKAFKDFKPRAPFIDKVVFEYIQDASVQFLKLKSRQIHIGSLDALQADRQIDAKFREDFRIVETSSLTYTYLGFNLKNPKFAEPKLREALSLAIDRQELIDILFFGHGKICTQPILEGALGFNPTIAPVKQDISRAKTLLAELGYTARNPLKITISTNANSPIRNYAAEIIQQQLAKAGVIVKIRSTEWQAFLTRLNARDFEVILMGWSVPLMPDPYTIWHSKSDFKGGFNMVGYKNDEVDRLIELSQKTSDRAEVARIFSEFSAIVARDNPYLFLYAPNSIAAISRKLSPIEPTAIGFGHNRFDWRIEP
ncbi:MAG: peptide-binding protein [Helicobacteraceae bacterium]|jgi:peptide/nickel transport system substrate-binding protein|nr:peptide-binding protein [Helicobacteraceae bacterium]